MSAQRKDGNAIIHCDRAFGTTNGKTAHGLVRRTTRYHVLSVVDSTQAGRDAGEVLDGEPVGIPILGSIREACKVAKSDGTPATHLVVGLAPDGGRLPERDRRSIARAITLGLHVDSGLHDFLKEDPELTALADENGVELRDVRRSPQRHRLHFFSGKIEDVTAPRVAVLGTDSAVGKRTTAWMLVDEISMLCALGADPTACGYTEEQVSRALEAFATTGVHQEAAAVQHTAHMLLERGLLQRESLNLETRERPEVMRLRFDPRRSPPDTIPGDLREPLHAIMLEHAEGASRRSGRLWLEVDPLSERCCRRPTASRRRAAPGATGAVSTGARTRASSGAS